MGTNGAIKIVELSGPEERTLYDEPGENGMKVDEL
jgi:hypothetical protein